MQPKTTIVILCCFSVLTCGVLLSSLSAGEQTAASNPASYRIGFAQDNMANDWRAAQVRALVTGFADYPKVQFFYTDAKGQPARQILAIEDMIHMGVDVMIASPIDANMMTPVISKAYHQHIPVILISRTIANDDYTLYIHPDNRRIAQQAAQFIADRLDGRGKIFILQHIPTTSVAKQRTEGFLEVIETYPQLSVASMKVANSLRSEAITMTDAAIREGVEFDAIYAQSDSMASGARVALEKHGIDPRKVVIVGIDYIREAREAIRSGKQAASFSYPTGGWEGVHYAMKILKGEAVPKEIIIDSVMVTQHNVETVEPIF